MIYPMDLLHLVVAKLPMDYWFGIEVGHQVGLEEELFCRIFLHLARMSKPKCCRESIEGVGKEGN
jgi:hypothetical protein